VLSFVLRVPVQRLIFKLLCKCTISPDRPDNPITGPKQVFYADGAPNLIAEGIKRPFIRVFTFNPHMSLRHFNDASIILSLNPLILYGNDCPVDDVSGRKRVSKSHNLALKLLPIVDELSVSHHVREGASHRPHIRSH